MPALPGDENDVRTRYCYNRKSTFGTTKEANDGLGRLANDAALSMGFPWRDMSQGEGRRSLKQAKRAHLGEIVRIVDRYAEGKAHAGRMDFNGISRETMQ